jgi:hypothetical protein
MPDVFTASTKNGDLSVSLRAGKGSLVAVEGVGTLKTTYQFDFSVEGFALHRVTGFTGVAVDRDRNGNLVSRKLVPLAGEDVLFEPECKMILPGIPTKRP